MNAIDIVFSTGRFNLSQVGNHFINPCCFGEDSVAWLREKLVAKGFESSAPGQEDWGWYLKLKNASDSYLIGISGNSGEDSARQNYGRWRIIVEKHRSIWQGLTGRRVIGTNDQMLQSIEEILRSEADFRDIHQETESR